MPHPQSVHISLPPLTDPEAYHFCETFSDILRIVENYYGLQIHCHLQHRQNDHRPDEYRLPGTNENPSDDETIPF